MGVAEAAVTVAVTVTVCAATEATRSDTAVMTAKLAAGAILEGRVIRLPDGWNVIRLEPTQPYYINLG